MVIFELPSILGVQSESKMPGSSWLARQSVDPLKDKGAKTVNLMSLRHGLTARQVGHFPPPSSFELLTYGLKSGRQDDVGRG